MTLRHATQCCLLAVFQVLHIFHLLSDLLDELSFCSRDDVFGSAVVLVRVKLAHLSEKVNHLDFWSKSLDSLFVEISEIFKAQWLSDRT